MSDSSNGVKSRARGARDRDYAPTASSMSKSGKGKDETSKGKYWGERTARPHCRKA